MSQTEKLQAASTSQLFHAEWKWAAVRNLEIACAMVATVLIIAMGWTLWLLAIPTCLFFDAASRQFGIAAARRERGKRSS